jgi:hypothetical protein
MVSVRPKHLAHSVSGSEKHAYYVRFGAPGEWIESLDFSNSNPAPVHPLESVTGARHPLRSPH